MMTSSGGVMARCRPCGLDYKWASQWNRRATQAVPALTDEQRNAIMDAAALCGTVCHYDTAKKLRALLAAPQPRRYQD